MMTQARLLLVCVWGTVCLCSKMVSSYLGLLEGLRFLSCETSESLCLRIIYPLGWNACFHAVSFVTCIMQYEASKKPCSLFATSRLSFSHTIYSWWALKHEVLFTVLVFGPHLMVLWTYSWFCTLGPNLVVLRQTIWGVGVEPGPTTT